MCFWGWTADAQGLQLTFNSVHLPQALLGLQADLTGKERCLVPWPCRLGLGKPDHAAVAGRPRGRLLDRGRTAAEPAYSPCSREPALPDGGSAGKGLHPIGSKSHVRQAKQLQPAYGGTTVLISNRAVFVNTPRKRQRYLEFKNVLQVKVS